MQPYAQILGDIIIDNKIGILQEMKEPKKQLEDYYSRYKSKPIKTEKLWRNIINIRNVMIISKKYVNPYISIEDHYDRVVVVNMDDCAIEEKRKITIFGTCDARLINYNCKVVFRLIV